MNKKQKSLIAVYAIIFVIFNVIYYAIPFNKGAASWIAYVFSLVSIAAGFYTTKSAFDGDTDLQSKIYGYPIFRVGVIYGVSQIVFSIIIFAVSTFVSVPAWISIVVSVLLLGLAAIGFIAVDNIRDVIEEQEVENAATTKAITYFNIDMGAILDNCTDAVLSKKLNHLAEELRYSDPVSNDALMDIEAQIKTEMDKLSVMIDSGDAEAENQIKKLENLLANRNRLCKATK